MLTRLIAGLVVLLLAVPAHAATVVIFDDKSAFLSSTGATNASGPIPPLGSGPPPPLGFLPANTPKTLRSVTFSATAGLWFGVVGEPEINWTRLLPGHEIAVNGVERLDVSLAAPVFSYGFDFVEPQFGPNINAPFVDSTFTVSLFSDATPVGAFMFNAPNDIAAFVGVWTDMQFNKVQIREIIGGIENEFFGMVYTGDRPYTGVAHAPIPAALPLFLTALAGLGFVGWRKKRAA